LPNAVKGGVNFGSYLGGVLHIIPREDVEIDAAAGGTSTIAIAVLEWSKGRNRFIETDITGMSALGAGESASFSFPALGRILWLHVTGITPGQSCSLYTSGNDESDR
jgi:hypothetical protein